MDIPLIRLEVTPDIAVKIRLMAEAGVFSLRKGNASLNFDNGELKSVKTEVYTYQHAAIDTLDEVSVKIIA